MAIRLNTPFESGSSPWGWQAREWPSNHPNDMQLSTAHAREGTRSLEISLHSTDSQAQNGSRRSELTWNNADNNINTVRWYGFSWYFPSATMPSDSRECVIIQWHDRALSPYSPSTCSTSPFLAIEAKNDRFRAMIRYSLAASYCPGGNGIVLRTPVDLGPIPKDVWVDVVIYYRPSVSTSTDPSNPAAGRIQIWMYEQGDPIQQVLDYTGPCFANGTAFPYLKWGVYKWLWNGTAVTPGSLTFYGDAFRIAEESDSFFTVAPQNLLNQPPIVNAGSPQAHSAATTSVTLTGTASDPGGSIASTLWTLVSGPNTPTITSVSSLSTTVTSMVPGTYQFRLTATDNLGATSSATVLIRINTVPTIDLTGNTTTYAPGTTSINLVSSTTDPDGVVVSRLWTQVDGPNNSSITSPTSSNTAVTGLQAGNYTYRLTVTDSDGDIAIDEVTINIGTQTIILGRPKKRFVEI